MSLLVAKLDMLSQRLCILFRGLGLQYKLGETNPNFGPVYKHLQSGLDNEECSDRSRKV